MTTSGPGEGAAGGGGARHRAREVALQVLYAIELARPDREEGVEDETGAPEVDADRAAAVALCSFDRVAEHFEVPARAADFARELVVAVTGCRDELDALIGAHSRNWRVSRMAAVDRNVLRVAVYELRYSDTPVAVVIDEAVDLARRFGDDASPAFVNGVLDAVAREVRAA